MSVSETSILTIDGQPLRVAIQPGSTGGLPLLCLSGIGASLEAFDPFVEALGGSVGILRVDLPGVGESPATILPYRFFDLARLVARLLDSLHQPEVDVLGVSWGGGLAQEFAFRYPGRCRRLVLVSTSTGAVMVPGRLGALPRMAHPRRYSDHAYLASIAAELYGGRVRTHPELARTFAERLRPAGARGYYWQLMAAVGWTSICWLHRLIQPTLVLSGTDDPIIHIANARLLAALIPGARLHLFDDGHLGLFTSAAELGPRVRDFLAGHAADAGQGSRITRGQSTRARR